jgi:septum formation protein
MLILQNEQSHEITQLILASASPGKQKLLRTANFDFVIDPADIDEDGYSADSLIELVQIIALAKANKVSERHKHGLILGADTLVTVDGDIIGKPKDAEHAKQILQKLSGKTHQIVTGLALIDLTSGKTLQRAIISKVTFKELSAKEIEDYIATGEPFGKAGAYSSQERGRELITKIDGDPENVIGLPIATVNEMVDKIGYRIVNIVSPI